MANLPGREVKKECPNKCGSLHMRIDTDFSNEGWINLYRCDNCGATLPRKTYKRGTEITPAQQKTADDFRREIERLKGDRRDSAWNVERAEFEAKSRYEFKEFRSEMQERGDLMVIAEYGMKNDENTAASIFCRERYQVWIGRKGGIWCFDTEAKGDARYSRKLRGVFQVALKGYDRR